MDKNIYKHVIFGFTTSSLLTRSFYPSTFFYILEHFLVLAYWQRTINKSECEWCIANMRTSRDARLLVTQYRYRLCVNVLKFQDFSMKVFILSTRYPITIALELYFALSVALLNKGVSFSSTYNADSVANDLNILCVYH